MRRRSVCKIFQHSPITCHQSQPNCLRVISQMTTKKAKGIFHGTLLSTMGKRLSDGIEVYYYQWGRDALAEEKVIRSWWMKEISIYVMKPTKLRLKSKVKEMYRMRFGVRMDIVM